MGLFEKVVRNKVRFGTSIGLLSAEDLWDLPLTHKFKISLDSIAIALDRELKECTTKSFVQKVNPRTETLQLKFDVVKRIIDVKLQESKEKEEKMARESRRQELLALKNEKRQELDRQRTMEEIDKELAELNN